MRPRTIVPLLGLTLLAIRTLPAADTIRLLEGLPVSGAVSDMTSTEVTILYGPAMISKKISVNEIESISFEEEPRQLTEARNAFKGANFEQVVKLLSKLDTSEIKRKEVKQDVEFYRAAALARLAIGGAGGKQTRQDAGKQLTAFEKANPTNYHYYEVCELIGNLLVALEKYKDAEPHYEKISSAPWPEYKMRAGVLLGRLLAAQKQHADAIKKFDEVLAASGSSKEAERQHQAAQLGKAYSLAASDHVAAGIALVEEVVGKAEKEDSELHARAYVVEGNCYLAAGKKKDAFLAFLHVDVLYPGFPEQHAEALANLATLWPDVYHSTEKADKAKSELKAKYPNSRWAQQ